VATRPTPSRTFDAGITATAVLSGLAVLDAAYNYFAGAGITGTEGALLVVISTLLMLIAALIIARGRGPGWLHPVLSVLLVLDFLGTAVAAYFLDAWVLLALVVLAAIGWAAHAMRPRASLARAG